MGFGITIEDIGGKVNVLKVYAGKKAETTPPA